MVVDYGAGCIGVECVLYPYGDVGLEYRVDCRRVNHLGAEIAELGGLDIAQMADGICVVDDAWVGCHETVNVGPYLEAACLQCRCDYGCRVVASATSKVRDFLVLLVLGDESRNYCHLCGVSVKVLMYESVGNLVGKYVFVVLGLGLDETACVETYCAVNESGYDAARNPFAVAHNCSLGFWGNVVYECKSLINVVQLVQQHVNFLQQRSALFVAWYYCVDEVVMACHNILELVVEGLVAVDGHIGGLYQPVCHSAECRYHYNHAVILGRVLYNALQVEYAVCGTYRCSAEFHYFHLLAVV